MKTQREQFNWRWIFGMPRRAVMVVKDRLELMITGSRYTRLQMTIRYPGELISPFSYTVLSDPPGRV